MAEGLFYEFLRDHFAKNNTEYVIAQKMAIFANTIVEAAKKLIDQKFVEAKEVLTMAMHFIQSEDSEDNLPKLKIFEKQIVCIECLLCYSYIMSSGSIEELGSILKNDSKLSTYMLSFMFIKNNGLDSIFLFHGLKTLERYLVENNLVETSEDGEELRIIDVDENLNKNKKMKTNKQGEESTSKTAKNNKTTKPAKENSKNSEKGVSKINSVNTQTEKLKTESKFAQTVIKKHDYSIQTEKVQTADVNIQVNLEKVVNYEILDIVMDIKNNINGSNKKEEELKLTIKQMKDVIENQQKEIDENKAINYKINMENSDLREKLLKLETETKIHNGKLASVQNSVLQLLENRRHMQGLIFKLYEDRCQWMIHFLQNIKPYVPQCSTSKEFNCDSYEIGWETRYKDIKSIKHNYLMNYIAMEREIGDYKNWRDIGLPELPDIKDDFIIPYISKIFKEKMVVNGKIPPKSSNSKKVVLDPNLNDNAIGIPTAINSKHKTREFSSLFDLSKCDNSDFVNEKSKHKKKTKNKEGAASTSYKIEATTSKNVKANSVKQENLTDEMLYKYLEEKTNLSEDDMCKVMIRLFQRFEDGLSGIPKERILEEIQKIIPNGHKAAWAQPKSTKLEWNNDNYDAVCSICFEEYTSRVSYTLPCKHYFHRDCIKKWLKTSSCCPICRIHTIFDEDFPPLY